MSDVLLYAALKENQKLRTEQLVYCTGGIGINFFQDSSLQAGYPYLDSSPDPNSPETVLAWQDTLSPLVEVNQSNGFKVWDTATYRCGASCSWTVPAGVSRVQFQMWGPGGGTSTNCCCGGAPFGPSGAYQVVTIDVTPGEAYTLCAGCATCCYATQTTPGGRGGASRVNGPGLVACATGGKPCYCDWNRDLESVNTHSCGIQLPDPLGNGCGANQCSGWNFCWDSDQDAVTICHAFAECARFCTTCLDETRNPEVYGINGLWPFMKLQAGFCGCTVSPPVFGFEDCVCTLNYCGNTCAGCNFKSSCGILQIPGAGGYASSVAGGCNACCGDAGRAGMVCVSWECN